MVRIKVERAVVGALMMIFGVAGVRAESKGREMAEPERNIRVRLYNYAKAPETAIQKGAKTATAIFQQAGITVDWVDCTPDIHGFMAEPACQKRSRATELEVKIAPRNASTVKLLKLVAFGVAQYPDNGFAKITSILYFKVEEAARATGRPLDIMLGHVIAHEMGHLLLGEGSHSSQGLMKARWGGKELDSAARGNLLFTDKQTARIRRSADRRLLAAQS